MAVPGRCLTWGPAAALSVSAPAARAQLASTTNPDGWPGAASKRAAFTDVVPKSIPRVTGREAMAAVTAQLRRLEPQAEELHPRRAARGPCQSYMLLAAASSDRWREDRRRDLIVRSSGTVPGVPGCSPRSTGFQNYNRDFESPASPTRD